MGEVWEEFGPDAASLVEAGIGEESRTPASSQLRGAVTPRSETRKAYATPPRLSRMAGSSGRSGRDQASGVIQRRLLQPQLPASLDVPRRDIVKRLIALLEIVLAGWREGHADRQLTTFGAG